MRKKMSNVICAIDTETTGLETRTAAVIELALVPVELPSAWNTEHPKAGRIIDGVEPFHVLIWPGYDSLALPSADKAMGVNGISVAQLKEKGVKPEHVPAMIEGWLMANGWDQIDPLAQNWAFDSSKLEKSFSFPVFNKLFSRHVRDVKRLAQSIIDLYEMCRREKAEPILHGTSLAAVSEHFGIVNPDPHRATGDSIATAKAYFELLELLYTWNRKSKGAFDE